MKRSTLFSINYTSIGRVKCKVSDMKEAAAVIATATVPSLSHHWQRKRYSFANVCEVRAAVAASLTKIFGSTQYKSIPTTATKYMHRPTTMHIIVISRKCTTLLQSDTRANTHQREHQFLLIFLTAVCRASRAC